METPAPAPGRVPLAVDLAERDLRPHLLLQDAVVSGVSDMRSVGKALRDFGRDTFPEWTVPHPSRPSRT